MATLKEVKKDLEIVSTIKDITGIYQEIAHLRMKKIRTTVLNNRKVFEALSQTYQRIRSAYVLHTRGLKNKEKSFRSGQTRKTVAVFLSANKPFYGKLILDIWNNLLDFLEENDADLVIVGRVGKYFAEKSGLGFKFLYFELDDVEPEKEKIKEIVELVRKYKKIVVFHGKYKTPLFQELAEDDISGGLPFKKVKNAENYLFEPSAKAVLDFFENQIIVVLFNQSIMEHQLAKYASRMTVMYQAVENAKKVKNKLKKEENKLKRQKLNKEQIKVFSGLNLLLWNK